MLTLSGGKWRGRKFAQSVGDNVRPTAIRAREGLFNVLEHRFGNMHGKRVADLFAGTGALGLEALSRGADFCCFVEVDAKTKRQLDQLLNGLSANTQVLNQSATSLNKSIQPYDLVLMDPPYSSDSIAECLNQLRSKGWVSQESLVVVELDAKEGLPEIAGYELVQDRKWGRNRFLFLELTPVKPN